MAGKTETRARVPQSKPPLAQQGDLALKSKQDVSTRTPVGFKPAILFLVTLAKEHTSICQSHTVAKNPGVEWPLLAKGNHVGSHVRMAQESKFIPRTMVEPM